jgi:hypothetical protein
MGRDGRQRQRGQNWRRCSRHGQHIHLWLRRRRRRESATLARMVCLLEMGPSPYRVYIC